VILTPASGHGHKAVLHGGIMKIESTNEPQPTDKDKVVDVRQHVVDGFFLRLGRQ
jgi:hypothetical protein